MRSMHTVNYMRYMCTMPIFSFVNVIFIKILNTSIFSRWTVDVQYRH